ncbi:MAG: hypothetical protein ACTSVD_00830 [Candidatus Thorarchaeota archaeon]|nr:MAG: hypothetical protein DRO93_07875 [Candidatus Thorarchaeota archaeon]
MTDEKNDTLRSVLESAADSKTRVRLFGHSMVILAEGKVAYVSGSIVALKRDDDSPAEEFVTLDSIVKVQHIKDRIY